MKQKLLNYGLFILFICILLLGLNARYPLIGEDYMYVFPRLLEGKWHALRQGIFPMRFAPHLCGGIPQYGNPQDHFYSLPQLFSFFFDVWTAVQLSMVIILTIGYAGWVKFGQIVLRLSRTWSHLLAIVCIANGFYFMHMLVGHLWIISLPLLSWMLYFVFFPVRESPKQLMLHTGCFAFLMAYVLYSGSQTLAFLALLIVLFFVPFDVLLHEHPGSRLLTLLRRGAMFGCAFLLLAASKLVAVYSLMRVLEVKALFSGYHAAENSVWYMARSFWGLPQSVDLLASSVKFSRIQEESMFTSHITLLGVMCAMYFFVRSKSVAILKKIAVLLYALLLVVFLLLLVKGKGFVPDHLQHFPLFSSLRVPERFLYIVSLLFCLVGVYGISIATKILLPQFERWLPFALGGVTLLLFVVAYANMAKNEVVSIALEYNVILEAEKKFDGYLELPVIEAFTPDKERISDFYYIMTGSTGTRCYEAFSFGYADLKNGPVSMVYDGAYNIYNPACLQYPKENNCKPGDRIREGDTENLERFINGRPTTWKLSTLQIVADWVTLMSITLLPVTLLFVYRRELQNVFVRIRSHLKR